MQMYRLFISAVAVMFMLPAFAQIGQHRNDLSIGVNGGYILSNVGFTPKVNQTFYG